MSSHPYLGDGRGAASLRLLNVLHRNIHPLLGQRWATTIPLLLEHLDGEAPLPLTPFLLVCIWVCFWGPEFFNLEETASPEFQGHGAGKVSSRGWVSPRSIWGVGAVLALPNTG